MKERTMRSLITAVAVALGATAMLASAAMAQEGFTFKVENHSAGAVTVSVDGSSKCTLDPGKSCDVLVRDEDAHSFAYSLAGAAPVSFAPGNLEAVNLCSIDAKGAHCTDVDGKPTN
jgi:uncharacterized membrane protein